jgi:hypothetical protein
MAASIDDKLSANYNNGVPRAASVVANRVADDGVLKCDGLAGWSTDTAVHFTTFTRSTDQFGNPSVANQQWFKGVVNGDSIIEVTKYDGMADAGNLVGDVVEPMVTAGYLKDLVSAVLVSLAQDGKLRASAVAEAFKAANTDEEDTTLDGIIKARNVGDGIIQPQHLDTSSKKIQSQTASGATSTATTKITANADNFTAGKAYLAIAQFRRLSTSLSDFDTYLSGGGMILKEGVDSKNGWSYITLSSIWRYTSGNVIVQYNSAGASNVNAWLEIYQLD